MANKTRKIIKRRRNKTHKKGGFIYSDKGIEHLKQNPDKTYTDLFKHVMDNSKKTLISYESLYGLIFRVELNSGVPSYFMGADKTEIRKFLLKISFINSGTRYVIKTHVQGVPIPKKVTMNKSSFEAEMKTQKDIFIKSIEEFGQSIVPEIQLHDNVIHDLTPETMESLATDDVIKNNIIKAYIDDAIKNKIKTYGAIVMAYAEGYQTMKERRKTVQTVDDDIRIYKKFQILLGLLGYVHQDAHQQNFMIKDENNAYIIDFGSAKSINLPRGNWKTNLRSIIKIISDECDLTRKRVRVNKRDWPCQQTAKWATLIHSPYDYDLLEDDVGALLDYFKKNHSGEDKRELLKRITQARTSINAELLLPRTPEKDRELTTAPATPAAPVTPDTPDVIKGTTTVPVTTRTPATPATPDTPDTPEEIIRRYRPRMRRQQPPILLSM